MPSTKYTRYSGTRNRVTTSVYKRWLASPSVSSVMKGALTEVPSSQSTGHSTLLTIFSRPEFASISHSFNRMAQALEDSIVENRRLALLVKGIGDLVLRRARDPADFDCLRELHSDLAAIRSAVDETSAHQARRRGPLPALFLPPRAWFDGDHAEQWLQHFEAARRREAVRHRNLLAMSPYSVMPSGSGCDPAFADLLPLLAFADAWAFSDPPRLENWNLNQFKHFHTRARAIIQASQATTRIAAGA